MNKTNQKITNECVNVFMKAFPTLTNTFALLFKHRNLSVRPLRHCSAKVYITEDGYKVLQSYSTIIAIITPNGHCYDFLRKVYGYTATSAKHISKFMQDYNATNRYTWREA